VEISLQVASLTGIEEVSYFIQSSKFLIQIEPFAETAAVVLFACIRTGMSYMYQFFMQWDVYNKWVVAFTLYTGLQYESSWTNVT
jgi:hypothetical protein